LALSIPELNAEAAYAPWKMNRIVWATFDAQDDSLSPFLGAPSAEYVCGVLGLDPNDKGPLLLFEYSLPPDVVPSIPTVADAYAGGVFQVFFRPAPGNAQHGLTMTWPAYSDQPVRPECVHPPFSGGTFISIRELR
jgi:hypothetical protein